MDYGANIESLRKKILEEFSESELKSVSICDCIDSALRRFLISRDNNLEKTHAMLRNTIKWRNSDNINSILHSGNKVLSLDDCNAIRCNHPQGVHGFDKRGNPIWIERLGYIDLDTLSALVSVPNVIKHHIQVMEFQHKVLFPKFSTEYQDGRVIERMTVIHDLSNVGRHNIRPVVLQVIRGISEIDQSHYPETLAQLFIVNAPFIFYGVWKMVEVFLNENTKNKIKILGKNYHKELEKYIENDQLPSFLGGKCTCHPNVAHGGCVSSKEFSKTKFFAELDAYLESNDDSQIKKSVENDILVKNTMEKTKTNTTMSSNIIVSK